MIPNRSKQKYRKIIDVLVDKYVVGQQSFSFIIVVDFQQTNVIFFLNLN